MGRVENGRVRSSFQTPKGEDARSIMAAYFSLLVSSIDEQNNVITNGLNAGGTEPNEMSDYCFMRQRTIEDPDGHTWNFNFMDNTKIPTEQPEE